ncbi:hypothetical protein BU24DRAFT_486258 [Aaosphaeria arxii CBS 175.79]|uniref:Nucleic acid-binding protein n=1 Tax=Aaosphaeria arxii CBS 175.79 TaxID=1450172 RepID=A0A6A5XFD7_9PLEO|nr:uncharacterized protein BU24DRAFT_486258 [Aaosphaeria arxii CBS 175.79]KAF2011537.1 hypothetical protein BU24DRAFT_486258 [Aaosphaeria arxii CBS 175.79]
MPLSTPSIQSYYSSSPSKSAAGDGFTAEEIANAINQAPPSAQWTPTEDYIDFDIGQLQPGPRFVTFMGRVVNIYDSVRNSKNQRAAKGCLKILVGDDTGCILVGLWYASTEYQVHMGQLVTVYAFHLSHSQGSPLTPSASCAPLYASIFPERERKCHIMFHDNSDDGLMCKRPYGCKDSQVLPGLVTLKDFTNGAYDIEDCKVIACIKSIGVRKRFTGKNGSPCEVVGLRLFDDTAEVSLTLYGAACHSTSRWQPSQTVLLISSPGWRIDSIAKLSMNASTRLDIDPDLADVNWLRCFAQRLMKKEHINPTFPSGLCDDAESSALQILFSLADVDEWARANPTSTFTGWISALITQLNIVTYFKRRMLMSTECCGIPLYANAIVADCQQCKQSMNLRVNPKILGPIIDETGNLASGKLILSADAWEQLLGRTADQLVAMDLAGLTYLEHRLMFIRLSWGFAFSNDVGRLCVWTVRP